MSNRMAAYYYALAGAIGALASWFVAGWLLDLMSHQSLVLRTAIKGLVIGAGIGGAICGRERVMLVNWARGLEDGAKGALFGAIGGAASSLFGLWMFNEFGQNILGRIVGYVCFGALIGTGEGWKWMSGHRAVRGATGGAAGGIIAALVYSLAARYVSSMIGDCLAVTALGGLMGLGISTACIVGNMAVLRVLAAPKDKLVGQLLPLGSVGDRDVIGSDPNVSVPVITDDSLAPAHAEVFIRGREFYIAPLKGDQFRPGSVSINSQRIRGETLLLGGEVIELGNSCFEFHRLADARVQRSRDGSFRPESDADRAEVLYR